MSWTNKKVGKKKQQKTWPRRGWLKIQKNENVLDYLNETTIDTSSSTVEDREPITEINEVLYWYDYGGHLINSVIHGVFTEHF